MVRVNGFYKRAFYIFSCASLLVIGTYSILPYDIFRVEKRSNSFLFGRSKESTMLPHCPIKPKTLVGRKRVMDVNETEAEKLIGGEVRYGGSWAPTDCYPRSSVAVIVPYRDRPQMIGIFAYHMHGFLQRQQLNYTFFIVEQSVRSGVFNKGGLYNVGFLKAREAGPYDCYIFHDIDCLPENDWHLYHCSLQPRHLGIAVSAFGYKLQYVDLVGGALQMSEDHVLTVNGWSNRYRGWGGEDDDMMKRIQAERLALWRYPNYLATYSSIDHQPASPNENRFRLLEDTGKLYKTDGLNSVNYTVLSHKQSLLYTHFLVDIYNDENVTLAES